MMPIGAEPRTYARAAFLAWEAGQVERWELLDGVAKPVPVTPVRHNLITGTLFALLHGPARRAGGEAFHARQKLAPTRMQDVVYPDVFVTTAILDGEAETVPSALIVVEVVNEDSRDDDIRVKLRLYQDLPELRHYLVVESDRVQVTHFRRDSGDGAWQRGVLAGAGERVVLDAIDTSLTLAEIYETTDLLP